MFFNEDTDKELEEECHNNVVYNASIKLTYSDEYFSIPFTNTNSYRFSYFPRTIDKWNHLPHHLLELDSVDLFVVNVIACMHVSN